MHIIIFLSLYNIEHIVTSRHSNRNIQKAWYLKKKKRKKFATISSQNCHSTIPSKLFSTIHAIRQLVPRIRATTILRANN